MPTSLGVFETVVAAAALLKYPNETPAQTNMNVEYEWRTVDYTWPSPAARDFALSNGDYKPGVALPFSMEESGDRLFISFGSFRDGYPATLATAPKHSQSRSPLLTPYPSWSWQLVDSQQFDSVDCSRKLVNVIRVRADRCGRLWVVDNGRHAYFNNLLLRQHCPPKIAVFDLATDEPIRIYPIPQDQYNWLTLFAGIEVDTGSGCDNAFAYITDSLINYRLVVYSWRDDYSWSVSHPRFRPTITATFFNIERLLIPGPDGIYSLTLSPPGAPTPIAGSDAVFWHSLGTVAQNWVPRSALQSPRDAHNTTLYRKLGERSHALGQMVMNAVDSRGIMFYSLANLDAVACWNTTQPYRPDTQALLSRGAPTLFYPAGLRVELRPDGDDQVWLLSTAALRTAFHGPFFVSTQHANVRVYRARARDLSRGSACETGQPDDTLMIG